jgi:hypothetical protein
MSLLPLSSAMRWPSRDPLESATSAPLRGRLSRVLYSRFSVSSGEKSVDGVIRLSVGNGHRTSDQPFSTMLKLPLFSLLSENSA